MKAKKRIKKIVDCKKEKFCEKIQAAKKVLSLNNVLNSTLNLDELLGIIMTTSADVMRAEVASLMLIDKSSNELVFRVALGEKGSHLTEKLRIKMGEGIAGSVAKSGKSIIVNNTKKDKRFAKRFDKSTGFSSKAIICVPMKVKGKIIGVLEAINPIGRKGFLKKDIHLFEVFANQAATAVENAKLHGELVHQEKTKQALKIAHDIQQNLLPKLGVDVYTVDVFAKSIPALEVGGDFYDVIKLGPKKTGLMIGDVSGKGIPAALYMVRAISEYRFLASQNLGVSEILNRLNQKLIAGSCFGMFVTAILMIIDQEKNELHYTSAGHHPILRRNKSGKTEFLEEARDVPIGLTDEITFSEKTIPIEKGDVFFLYTDGITEARNKSKKEYGIEKMSRCVKKDMPSATHYGENIFNDLKKFTLDAEQHDDMTIVSVVIPV